MVKGRQHHIFLDNGPSASERVQVFEFQSQPSPLAPELWFQAQPEAKVVFCARFGCMSHSPGLLSLENNSVSCQTKQDHSKPVLWS